MSHGESEALWLATLRDEAADTVELLTSARKQERERRTCAAFLRCAGVGFTADQIVSSRTEPPDIVFGRTLFEITVVLPPGRRMHDEWRDTTARRTAAQQIGDLIEPYVHPEVLTRETLVHMISPASEEKASRYSARNISCREYDLLVYVNWNAVLQPESPDPDLDAVLCHGWRSLSVLLPPYSYVVFATPDAPQWLRDIAGTPTAATRTTCGLFDL
ncbi:MAG: DUF1780 domain-containing protein [Bryobacteraceae bacterium]|jgi:hypothetical protein